jgi:hypothetical protein
MSRSNVREARIVWEKSRRELPRITGFEKFSSRSYDLPEGKLEENVVPQRSSSEAHVFWKSTASRTLQAALLRPFLPHFFRPLQVLASSIWRAIIAHPPSPTFSSLLGATCPPVLKMAK